MENCKEYQEYLERCKEFNKNSGKVSRDEILFSKTGYYIFSEERRKYVFSTDSYLNASAMNSDGIIHIYVSTTELVASPF